MPSRMGLPVVESGISAGEFSSSPTGNPDIVSALIAYWRTKLNVTEAFDDNEDTPKFFSNFAVGLPKYPYAIVTEPGEEPNLQSINSRNQILNFALGTLEVTVYSKSKLFTRQLIGILRSATIDPPLRFDDGDLLEFRYSNEFDPPDMKIAAPTSPVVYKRTLEYLYRVQRVHQ